jgi:hypothetical protein
MLRVCSFNFSISLPTVILSCMSRKPFGCCSKKLRTISIAWRASSGLVGDKFGVDAGVMDRGTLMLDGKGGGRIVSDGATVFGRLLIDSSGSAELRFGRGSVSSCIGESKVAEDMYFGIGGSAELVTSDM